MRNEGLPGAERARLLGWILAGGLVAACAGDGSTLDELGRPAGRPFAPALGSRFGAHAFPPTFSAIASELFTPICTECHAGASAPRGLDLSPEAAFEALVDRPSSERPAIRLVAPGDPDASYLVIKLEAGPGMAGRQMPRNRAARPAEEVAVIRQWIAEGAPRN